MSASLLLRNHRCGKSKMKDKDLLFKNRCNDEDADDADDVVDDVNS